MSELPRILIVGADPSLAAVLAEKLAGQATIEVVADVSKLPVAPDAPLRLLELSDLPELPVVFAQPVPSLAADELVPCAGYRPPRRGKKGKPVRW
ncbi:hypothetical protein WJ97_13050 [Burkholderia ubonensis]|uniref:hypothetical protein n=1 Tax=Burkholderia ubonensis TaxID=101571 RepID=UPI0007551B53|nr:hypothetical protein [Burkholderia ubonensis]KVP96801.1 hypothetical protein WJ97_13050 [Burkholderia ubonensis]